MQSIMFDFDILKHYKIDNLIQKINVPKVDNKLGIIFICDKDIIKNIDDFKNKDDKLNYLNSEKFIFSDYIIFDCDINKKICIIQDIIDEYFNIILESFLLNFPSDFFIVLKVNNIEKYLKYNFNYALINNNEFILYKMNNTKTNNIIDNNIIKFLKKVLSKKKCEMFIRLEKNTIENLKKICFTGSTLNSDNTISQKELAGKFIVKEINDKLEHVLDLDIESINNGLEDSVMIHPGLYNFHTHPYYTYNKYKTKHGFPSVNDFIAFVSSNVIYKTLCHFVISLEGIYIILLNKENININDDILDFISVNYNVCKDNFKNAQEYIEHINNIKYNNSVILNVKFYDWTNNNIVFPLTFKKYNNNCLYDDNMLKLI